MRAWTKRATVLRTFGGRVSAGGSRGCSLCAISCLGCLPVAGVFSMHEWLATRTSEVDCRASSVVSCYIQPLRSLQRPSRQGYVAVGPWMRAQSVLENARAALCYPQGLHPVLQTGLGLSAAAAGGCRDPGGSGLLVLEVQAQLSELRGDYPPKYSERSHRGPGPQSCDGCTRRAAAGSHPRCCPTTISSSMRVADLWHPSRPWRRLDKATVWLLLACLRVYSGVCALDRAVGWWSPFSSGDGYVIGPTETIFPEIA